MDNNHIHENIQSFSHDIEDHNTQSQPSLQNSVENQGSSSSKVYESPGGTRYWTPVVPDNVKPFVGAKFRTLDEAIIMYENYGEAAGFGTRLSTRKQVDGVTVNRYILCSNAKTTTSLEGDQNVEQKAERSRCSNIKSTGCNACVRIRRVKNSTNYEIYKFIEVHNHGCVPTNNIDLTRKKRQLDYNTRQFIANCRTMNIGPTKAHKLHVVLKGGPQNVHGTVTDYKNWGRDIREYVADGDAQMLVDKLTERSKNYDDYTFETRIIGTELQSFFWADKVSKINYQVFGDVIAFDATYHSNMYDMIMVNFIGLDHHKKVTVFGAGMLHNETIESYIWLLQMFVKAHGKKPALVLTDQDAAMKQAVKSVFNNSIHRLCMWHVTDKLPLKIDGDMINNTNIKRDFHKLVWDVYLEPATFEEKWHSLMAQYKLNDNKWLSDMFEIREQWAPSYFRETPMCCLVKTTSHCESANHMFKSISSASNTLVQFMMCYDTVIDGLRKQQRILDHSTATTNPDYRTPHQIERHANQIYTRRIFRKVSKEIYKSHMYCMIVERNILESSFKVAHQGYTSNFINEENVPDYTHEFKVTLDKTNLSVSCECMGFIRIGYLCCHVFCVFRHHNINQIPLKYVQNRWRRDALPSFVHDTTHRYLSNQTESSGVLQRITNNFDMCVDRARGDPEMLKELDIQMQAIKDNIFALVTNQSEHNKKKVVIPEIISYKQPEVVSCSAPKGIRNKGCGTYKRKIGAVEKVKKQYKKPKRHCNYCDMMVRGHDTRNCPLKKGKEVVAESTTDEDDLEEASSDENEE